MEGNGTPLQYSCLENPMDGGAWWAAVHGVAEGWALLSDFTFNFHFHAWEKEMATHSSVLAWRISGTREPGGLLSLGSHRVRHNWSDLAAAAALWMLECVFLFQLTFWCFLKIYPGMELLNRLFVIFLVFWRTSILFSAVEAPIYILSNSAWGFPLNRNYFESWIFKLSKLGIKTYQKLPEVFKHRTKSKKTHSQWWSPGI